MSKGISRMIRSWWLHIVTVLLLFALFTYGFRVRSAWVTKLASCFVYPVLLVQHVFVDPIKQHGDQMVDIEKLQDQLRELKKMHEQTLAENVKLRATLSYMNDTEELRDYQKRYHEHEGHITQILVRHFSEKEHYFYVDGGSNKGIEPDMVAVYKNNLIGKVTHVYPWYSKISLITDRTCKVAAYCAKTKTPGIHKGTNCEGQTALCYVDHLAQVHEGDLVLSSGEGLVFPQGFALGSIKTCQTDDLYKQITLEPGCDLRSLDYCVIIDKN